VQQAGFDGVRRKGDPSGIHARDFFDESHEVRHLFARLVGAADPLSVAILPAVSYGVATIARNTHLERGQNVVIAGEQFPSNVYAWRRLCTQSAATLRTVRAPDAARRGEAWSDALLDAIDAGTALVALPQVHWTDGTRFDLDAIGERARACGAAFVIDASQSLGAYPCAVDTLRADAILCAGYKWLLGPYSIALGWFGERYDDGEPLEESWIARAGSEDFQALVDYRDDYQPAALRYDVGERSNFILLPMMRAALEQLLAWDPARIQDYCTRLLAGALHEAESLGFRVESAAWRGSHLVGLRVPAGADLRALQAALQAARVSVSLRGSALRISPNIYNDEGDVEALLAVLRAFVS
jgi:selenocysteine lyase/cysteine desulfurase